MALAFLAGAVRVGAWLRPLLVLHLVFGLVKLVAYDEPEAALFMGVDVLLLGMLSRRR